MALIERAKQQSGLTIWQYSQPEELRDRVREDITALVSRNFKIAVISSSVADDDDTLAARLVPDDERFRRPVVERELLAALDTHRVLQVVGEMGVGKTMLLGMLAADRTWLFVSGRGRTPTELAQAADMGGDPISAVGYWQQAEVLAKEAAPELSAQIRLEQLTRKALKVATPEQLASRTHDFS